MGFQFLSEPRVWKQIRFLNKNSIPPQSSNIPPQSSKKSLEKVPLNFPHRDRANLARRRTWSATAGAIGAAQD
jgi:hypothetical protein